jgi:hypothetical protein
MPKINMSDHSLIQNAPLSKSEFSGIGGLGCEKKR